MEAFKEKFNYILLKHLLVREVDLVYDAKLKEDLGADSLDMVEMVMDFEKEFSIRLPDESIDHSLTVGGLEDMVRQSIANTKQFT